MTVQDFHHECLKALNSKVLIHRNRINWKLFNVCPEGHEWEVIKKKGYTMRVYIDQGLNWFTIKLHNPEGFVVQTKEQLHKIIDMDLQPIGKLVNDAFFELKNQY